MTTTAWTASNNYLRSAFAAPAGPAPTLAQIRAHFAPAGRQYPCPDDVAVVAVDAGGVPAHWFRAPHADDSGAVLYLHGGGYALGSAGTHGELIARIARASGLPVLAVDYRLAPEHPYPAAGQDARTAWQWLTTTRRLLPSRLGIAGDSAGGGLALALLLALRDDQQPLPRAAALMSPWTDLTLSGASMTEQAGEDPVLSAGLLTHLAQDYLAGQDPTLPGASPLYGDLTGLPPLLIQVGTAEILLSDSERLADRAREHGVEVTVQIEDGAPHIFPSLTEVPEAHLATTRLGAFLASATSAGAA